MLPQNELGKVFITDYKTDKISLNKEIIARNIKGIFVASQFGKDEG